MTGRGGTGVADVRRIIRTVPPSGMTSDEIAALLPQHKRSRVMTILSDLALYGEIDRDVRRADASGMYRKFFIYKPKVANASAS